MTSRVDLPSGGMPGVKSILHQIPIHYLILNGDQRKHLSIDSLLKI